MKTKRRKKYNKKSLRKKSYKKKTFRKQSYRKNKFRNLKGKGLFFKSKKQSPDIHYVVHRYNPTFEDTSEAFMHYKPIIYRKSFQDSPQLDPPPSYFETTDKNYHKFYNLIVKQKEINIKCNYLEKQKEELNKKVLLIDKLIKDKKSYLTMGIGSLDEKKTNKEIKEYELQKVSIERTSIPKIEKELEEATNDYKNNEFTLETEYTSYYNEYKSILEKYKFDA